MYEVDKSIIDLAVNCDIKYNCLSEGGKPCCNVESCVNCSVHFLEKLERDCLYHQEFGFSNVCICPVRKEIYRKYKV